eukprot:g29632.t1
MPSSFRLPYPGEKTFAIDSIYVPHDFINLYTSVFKYTAENLDTYVTTIVDLINKCVKDCAKEGNPGVPNQKLWMNWEIYFHAAFKSDNPGLYRKSRYDLRKAIRDAKRQYWTRLEAQTNHMDSCCSWQGLNNISGYNMKQTKIADKDTFLPDALNVFYAQFKQNASSMRSPALTAPKAPAPFITAADVRPKESNRPGR